MMIDATIVRARSAQRWRAIKKSARKRSADHGGGRTAKINALDEALGKPVDADAHTGTSS